MKKIIAAGTLIVAATVALSACTPPTASKSGGAKKEQIVKAMWNQAFYAFNSQTSSGNNVTNSNIAYMATDGPTYYDKALNLVPNKSFASYEKVSDSPLTIKMTIADTAKWSDGTPVTPADFLLAYGASSTIFNDVKEDEVKDKRDKESDEIAKLDKGVFFDSASPSYALIKDFPKLDGKTFTYTYSKNYGDWESSLISPLLPAHIVAKRALATTDAKAGTEALVKAFKDNDKVALNKIANVWNRDWNFTATPSDPDLLVVCGPMMIKEIAKDQFVRMVKNPKYEGKNKPKVDEIQVRFNKDPQASVQALQNGEVNIIAPQSTAGILKSLQAAKGIKTETSTEAAYEHIDLTMNNGGPFDPKKYGGDAAKAKAAREAFLLTLPRQDIIDKLIKPLNAEAKIRNSFTAIPGTPRYAPITEANKMEAIYGTGGQTDKAKEKLKAAGLTEMTVRFMYAEGNPRRQQLVQLVTESAAKAGIKVVAMPSAEWSKKLGDKSYDAVTFAWSSTSTGVTESEATYRTGGQNNKSGYTSTVVDKAYDELSAATDDAKKTEALKTIEKQLVDDAFGVTVFQFPGIMAHSENLAGASSLALSPNFFWNFWEWELK